MKDNFVFTFLSNLMVFEFKSFDFFPDQHFPLYKKIGVQNGSPGLQFYIDWKKFNLSFTQILRVFLAVRLHGLQKRLHLCMSKSAHESSCSIQSLKMKFWMIFKLAGPKNMDFSDFEAGPQGIGNCGGSILGSEVWKISPS